MISIDRNTIEATQGDSVRFTISITGRNVPEGTEAVVTVKDTYWEPAGPKIEKRLPVMSGKVHVLLDPEETRLAPGEYVWDVRLIEPAEDGGAYVLTPMEYGVFRMLPAIGRI